MAIRCHIYSKMYQTKSDFGWGVAPDPAREAYPDLRLDLRGLLLREKEGPESGEEEKGQERTKGREGRREVNVGEGRGRYMPYSGRRVSVNVIEQVNAAAAAAAAADDDDDGSDSNAGVLWRTTTKNRLLITSIYHALFSVLTFSV